MKLMKEIYIDLKENSYSIFIESGVSKDIESYLQNSDKTMVITDGNVDKLYGDSMMDLIQDESYKYVIEAGEKSKTITIVEKILTQMMDLNFTRNSKIIALGGGVVGDVAGFVASIYMRGISFIQVPTSLLAAVDSSVGGKTGVNLPNGKNMIGSFYQPEAVLIDIDLLDSLPKGEIISGIGEIVKYGIISDYQFLEKIEKDLEAILKLDKEVLKDTIARSCEIKADIVSKDERETGIRKRLNHGHTIAHSLETASKYQRYSHGEAVLIGMYYESLMAKNMGYIDEGYFSKIDDIIKSLNISLDISAFSKEELIDNMMRDKKNKDGKVSFILPRGRGRVKEVILERGELFEELKEL